MSGKVEVKPDFKVSALEINKSLDESLIEEIAGLKKIIANLKRQFEFVKRENLELQEDLRKIENHR